MSEEKVKALLDLMSGNNDKKEEELVPIDSEEELEMNALRMDNAVPTFSGEPGDKMQYDDWIGQFERIAEGNGWDAGNKWKGIIMPLRGDAARFYDQVKGECNKEYAKFKKLLDKE